MEITKDTILRAWKDEQYRSDLPEDVRAQLPARPTDDDGAELTDEQLETAAGGITPLLVAGGIALAGGSIAAGYGASELADGDC